MPRADHDDRHRQPENAEHRTLLSSVKHIRRGQKRAGNGKTANSAAKPQEIPC